MAVGIARSCAKSRFRISILLFFTWIGGVTLFVLSLTQMALPTNKSMWSSQCNKDGLLQFVTPFRAQLQDNSYVSCPWPVTETVFRIVVSLSVIIFVILLFVTLKKMHWTAIWILCRYAILVCCACTFAVFVLDCDQIRTGFNLCRQNFTIDNMQIIDIEHSVKKCWLIPFLWTIFVDLGLAFFLTWAYLAMQFYPYTGVETQIECAVHKKDMEMVPDHEPEEDAQPNSRKSVDKDTVVVTQESDNNVDKNLITSDKTTEGQEDEPKHWGQSNLNAGSYE